MIQPFEIGTARAMPGDHATGEVVVIQPADTPPTRIPVILVRGHTSGPSLCVCGGVHGDEYAAIEAVTRLARELDPSELAGTLVAVPIANPLAFEKGEPTSLFDYKNLNRVFPGSPEGSPTERIAYSFLNEVVCKCNALIDLHTGGKARILDMAIAQRGYEELAWDLATATGLSLFWRGGSWGGTGRISALKAGIPAITVEIGGGMECAERDVTAHINGVMNIMRYLGMIGGEPRRASSWRVIEADSTYAGANGFFHPLVQLGDNVQAGQLVARISDAYGNTVEELRSQQDGLVCLVRVVPKVQVGNEVLIIGTAASDQGAK